MWYRNLQSTAQCTNSNCKSCTREPLPFTKYFFLLVNLVLWMYLLFFNTPPQSTEVVTAYKDGMGRTCLHFSAMQGHLAIVQYLLGPEVSSSFFFALCVCVYVFCFQVIKWQSKFRWELMWISLMKKDKRLFVLQFVQII